MFQRTLSGRQRGTVYALLCISLWALIPVVAKLGQTELDNHQFLFWSSLVSLLVTSGYAGFRRSLSPVLHFTVQQWLQLSILGLLGTYIYYLFLYLGYLKATGMEVLVIQYTWPLIIVILSRLILKEQLTLTKGAAVMLGFLGVCLVLTKGNITQVDINNPLVIALVAAGATCFALFSVLGKRVSVDPALAVAVYFAVASVASLVSMLSLSHFAMPSSATEWSAVLLNGILVNGFSYVLWILALKSTDASYLAPLTFMTPVLSAFYLVIFFDEPLLPAYAVGLCLVIAGGIINSQARSSETSQ